VPLNSLYGPLLAFINHAAEHALSVSLVAGVAVVSLGLALYQAQAERRGLRRELERRGLVVAEKLGEIRGAADGRTFDVRIERLVVAISRAREAGWCRHLRYRGAAVGNDCRLGKTGGGGTEALERALQSGGRSEAFFQSDTERRTWWRCDCDRERARRGR